MRLFIVTVSLLFAGKGISQSSAISQNWYNISFDGLMHYTFNGKYMKWEKQSFSFVNKEGKERGKRIIEKCEKGNLVCLIVKDSIDGKTVFHATIIRKATVAGAMDIIMNYTSEDYSDTAELKKSFYSCDSSKFMIMRCYDRSTIQGFRKLKNIKSITDKDYKKIHDLYESAVSSLKNQFDKEDIWFIEPILRRQKLTDILVTTGYNPLMREEELNKFFSLYQ